MRTGRNSSIKLSFDSSAASVLGQSLPYFGTSIAASVGGARRMMSARCSHSASRRWQAARACSSLAVSSSIRSDPTACPSFLSEHEWMLRDGYMLALRIELACILPGMKRLSHAIGTTTSRCSHAWRGDHLEFDWVRGCRWAWRRAGGGASSIGQGVNSCRRTSACARLPRKRPPKPSSARTNHRRFS